MARRLALGLCAFLLASGAHAAANPALLNDKEAFIA